MAIRFIWYGVLSGETWSHAALRKSVAQVQQQEMSPLPYVINIIGATCTCFFYRGWFSN